MTDAQLIALFILGPAVVAAVIILLVIWVSLSLTRWDLERRQKEMAAELEALDRRNAAARDVLHRR